MTRNFTVLGQPAPKGNLRAVQVGPKMRLIEKSKRTGTWTDSVRFAASQLDGVWAPRPIPVSVDIAFFVARPKRLPKNTITPATRKPDIDKLVRAVLDGMTGVLYQDDSQVVSLLAAKSYCDRCPNGTYRYAHIPRAEVRITFEPPKENDR